LPQKLKVKKSTGITGNTSTIGQKRAYASGNFASRIVMNTKKSSSKKNFFLTTIKLFE
jgi:hypothetical protein